MASRLGEWYIFVIGQISMKYLVFKHLLLVDMHVM